jgi:hypothetical protein
MGEDVGWLLERSPGVGVGGHGCSRARGAVAGGGRSALPSAAGVGTIPRSRAQVWGVFPGGRAHRAAVRLAGEGRQKRGSTESGSRFDEVLTSTTRVAAPDRGQEHHRLERHSPTSTTPSTGVAPVESSDVGGGPPVTRLRIWRLGVRIPRGAPANPQLSGPATGLLALSDSPDCDQTATTLAGSPEATATTCDHLRPQWPRHGPFLLATAGAGAYLGDPAGMAYRFMSTLSSSL